MRRFFDPETYRIILFDQRGAGKSRPSAELKVLKLCSSCFIDMNNGLAYKAHTPCASAFNLLSMCIVTCIIRDVVYTCTGLMCHKWV